MSNKTGNVATNKKIKFSFGGKPNLFKKNSSQTLNYQRHPPQKWTKKQQLNGWTSQQHKKVSSKKYLKYQIECKIEDFFY